MSDKKCTKCGEIKPLELFHNRATSKDGKTTRCKVCRISETMRYQEVNKEKYSIYQREYAAKNSDHLKDYYKKWADGNVENKKKSAEYYQNNKAAIREQHREYCSKNKDKLRIYHRNYMREYVKNRCKSEPEYKIIHLMRSRLYKAIKRNQKAGTTISLVGCTSKELKIHIEKQFTDGMTWDNYGSWHMDHIIPCVSFDMSDPEQQRECFNYTNLQPLWAADNWSKGSRNL